MYCSYVAQQKIFLIEWIQECYANCAFVIYMMFYCFFFLVQFVCENTMFCYLVFDLCSQHWIKMCASVCVCWMFSMRCENVVHRLLLLLLLKLFIFRWLCECVKFMYVNMWAGILCVDTIIFGVYKTKLSDNTTTAKNYQRSLKMYFVARTNREKKLYANHIFATKISISCIFVWIFRIKPSVKIIWCSANRSHCLICPFFFLLLI